LKPAPPFQVTLGIIHVSVPIRGISLSFLRRNNSFSEWEPTSVYNSEFRMEKRSIPEPAWGGWV
jgi:hypothetical protein